MLTLTVEVAAKFVGCRSLHQFRRDVKKGIWPQPIAPTSRPQRWSVVQLEEAAGKHRPDKEDEATIIELEKRLGLR